MREWLVTNRLGSFAMGTPQRTPERKYHGLFVLRQAGLDEPLHILSDVNEVLRDNGRTFELASWHYDGADHPRGFEHQKSFDPAGPSWRYECGDARLTRTLELKPDCNELHIHYHILGTCDGAELRLSPQFTARGLHQLGYENPYLDGRAHDALQGVQFRLYRDTPAVSVRCEPACDFVSSGFWNRKVDYPEEARRGYPNKEDLFCSGYFRVPLHCEDKLTLILHLPGKAPALKESRWEGPSFNDPSIQEFANTLQRAAEQFVYFEATSRKPGVIAGYPWFGEWARDTLIALPGLLLETARIELAAAVLDRYAESRRDGLIPNLVGTSAAASDGFSVDASLWFIRAVQDVHTQEGRAVAGRWFGVVHDILDTLREGLHGVRIAENGLLAVDVRPRPGTWMDAQVAGAAVTPRAPFAVELNALFYNALQYGLRLAGQGRQSDFLDRWQPIKERFEKSFRAMFWLDGPGYLADSHDGNKADTALRPNQLIAASLPFKLLSRREALRMLENVRQHLRTPFGLRTLAPSHEAYRGRIAGTQEERDRAYHNGTVWPWLLGPYVDVVNFARGEEAATVEVTRIAADFRGHLEDACVGQVSEIFDGDEPHAARGAPAQAWSVAELLRVTCRYAHRNDERSRRMNAVLSESAGTVMR